VADCTIDWDAFFTLHHEMPREGPGSDAMTEQVARALPPLPDGAILDLGCGPGRQTLVLARVLRHSVVAVDTHRPYLERLAMAADHAGLSTLIETRQQSFFNLADEPGGVALIWAEGSIYIPGFVDGLRMWRPLLVPDGLLVASDVVWLTNDPPDEVRAFWESEGAEMRTVAEKRAQAEAEGYALLDTHALPREAWWDEYYAPLEARSNALRAEAGPALTQVLDANDHEIDMWRRFGDSFGYVFFVLRKVGDGPD
jgi:serine/threonine-protein kinase HipA